MIDASMFEVANDATTEIEIYDNAGAPTGIFITVYSSESDVAQTAKRKALDRRIAKMQRRGSKTSLKAEELEAEAMELRVTCTKSWRELNYEGKALECNDENKRMIYTRISRIRDQVDEAIADVSLFTKR
jgi:hypothetical protein